jgi:hypothetical protein
MGDVIDIWHYRRAQRLFRLLVERSGVESFLVGKEEAAFQIDPARLDDAVVLAASWLELQTGRPASAATEQLMRNDLRRLLIRALARHLVDTGY